MMNRSSRVGVVLASLLGMLISGARGDMPVSVVDWKQAIQARLQIEAQWPGTHKLFSGQEPGDRPALIDALATDKSAGLPGAWVLVARVLAESPKGNHLQGESLLDQAVAMGQGHPGFLFEGIQVLLQAGQWKRAKTWESALQKELLTSGYLRSPAFAKVVLAQARLDMKRGQSLLASQRIDFAQKLDPVSPWNALARLEMRLREVPPWSWNLGEIWQGLNEIAQLLRFYHNALPLLYNAAHWLRVALQGFGLFLLLALLMRHFQDSTHLLAERLPRVVEISWRYLAIVLVGASLWVAGVGFLYLTAPLALFLWKSARPFERSRLKWILIGLLCIPFGLTLEHALLRHMDPDEGMHLYHRAFESGFDVQLARQVEGFSSSAPMDPFYKSMAMSLQYRKLGNTVKAEQALQAAKGQNPNHALLLLQAGNLDMMVQDYSGAEKQYLAAMKSAPTWVETWFNASQAALFLNRSDAHKMRLDRAASADAGYLTQFLRENDAFYEVTPPLRRSMDPMLRLGMALSPGIGELASLGFLREEMASGLLTVPAWALLALTFACMLAIALRQRHHSPYLTGKSTFQCKICRKVMCRHCRKGVHCESCFKSVVGVTDMRLREELVQRLRTRSEAWENAIYRSLNTALPGLGDLYVGAGGFPVLWMLLAVGSWALMLQVGHPVMEYPVQSLGVFAYLAWLPLALVYGLYNAFTYLPGGKRLVAGAKNEVAL